MNRILETVVQARRRSANKVSLRKCSRSPSALVPSNRSPLALVPSSRSPSALVKSVMRENPNAKAFGYKSTRQGIAA